MISDSIRECILTKMQICSVLRLNLQLTQSQCNFWGLIMIKHNTIKTMYKYKLEKKHTHCAGF